MNIWFFEEFPKKQSLEKARLIRFPSNVFIAAKSLEEFQKAKKELKQFNKNTEAAYWPTLKTSYWISPFSNTEELISLYEELKSSRKNLKVLIDLELPTMNSPLFWKNINLVRKNTSIVKNILKLRRGIQIFTTEYPTLSLSRLILELLAITPSNINKIPMCYTSIMFWPQKLFARKTKSKYVGVGVIAKGINRNEPILSPQEMDLDLRTFAKSGAKTAVIFRLGGLNSEYIKVIEKYL